MLRMRLTSRLYINPLLFAFAVVMLACGQGMLLLVHLPAIVVHECAHLLSARACGIGFLEMELLPFGCRAVFDDMGRSSASKEILTVFLGPAANLVFAAALIPVMDIVDSGYLREVMHANLALAAVNMLPALPLDGGRILRALLQYHLNPSTTVRLLSASGILFALAMLTLFALSIAQRAPNPSFGVMGFFLLLSAIKELKRRPATFSAYAKKRRAMNRERSMLVSFIAAPRDRTLSDVARQLDANRYNVVYVLDDDMGRARELDEKALFHAMLTHGSQSRLGDL